MFPHPGQDILRDRAPLRDDHAPETIRHRDDEMNHLASLLSPYIAGGISKAALVHGPPGTGKTCTTTAVLNEVDAEFDGVTTVTADCWTDHKPSRVLYTILEQLVGTTTTRRDSTAVDELLYRIKDAIDEPTIIFLDEADKLTDELVLRDLYEIGDVRLVLAANNPHQVFGDLEPRVYSRLGTATRVEFEPYHDHELVAILEDRIQAAGVRSEIVSGAALEAIADAAERDARKAIAILRNALDTVATGRADVVTDAVIGDAVVSAGEDIARARISSLTSDQRVVLEVLLEIGPATSTTIYDAYASKVDDPFGDRAVRGWLGEKFQQYNLVRVLDDRNPQEYALTDAARVIVE
ncbi:Cdc6/Cdc18 family protein [Halosolutus gelatinilyticus]|uniref:Cdc6/Cdc18 family protein n=1 Tax=Halosolutus gelatinilyticus TaxID=2931975 RepID=UPI001FF55249|nr:Cdc6/Cdc18 family protein [Halosolutus gelatinilyticus]